ncbi:MAG: hypothetical protein K1060chlam2_00715 [Chlamydiae bacterium]|nr:hypothetical protein [Chlamydiota bacterium]
MNSWTVFRELLRRDLLSFRRAFPTKFFDMLLLFFTNVIVFGYFMQLEGAHAGYAAFFVVGAIASFGFIEIVGKVGILMADLQGDKTINHMLVMPIRTEWVFYYMGVSWALTSAILSSLLFPVGKLLVFDGLVLADISYWKLIIIFPTINLFFGFFALWLTGVLKNMRNLTSLWLRYIAPMWMFGAYTYSWHAAYQMSPVLGLVSLINPMVYVMEGMRAAMLGQAGYLPFWGSLLALWGFTALCCWDGVRRLKKRLDCV